MVLGLHADIGRYEAVTEVSETKRKNIHLWISILHFYKHRAEGEFLHATERLQAVTTQKIYPHHLKQCPSKSLKRYNLFLFGPRCFSGRQGNHYSGAESFNKLLANSLNKSAAGEQKTPSNKMTLVINLFGYVVVAFLWGFTTPFMKAASAAIRYSSDPSLVVRSVDTARQLCTLQVSD